MSSNVVVVLASTLLAYLIAKLLRNWVIGEVGNRFGVHVSRAGITSLSGLSYVPVRNGQRDESVRVQDGIRQLPRDSKSRFKLHSLKLDTIWADIHGPSNDTSSWITIRVAAPNLILSRKELGNSIFSDRGPATSQPRRGLRLRKVLDGFGRMLRNSSIRIFFRFVDMRIENLAVCIQDQHGKTMLRYFQENLDFRLHSNKEPVSDNGASGLHRHRRPNIHGVLAVSPFAVSRFIEPGGILKQVIATDSDSAITFTAHASVLGRLEESRLDMRINGLCVSIDDLIRITEELGFPVTDEMDNPIVDTHPSPLPAEPDLDKSPYTASHAKDLRMLMQERIKALQWRIADVVEMNATLDLLFTRTSITYQPSAPKADNLEMSLPGLLGTLQQLSVNVTTMPFTPISTVGRSIAVKAGLKDASVDLFNLRLPSQSSSQIFVAREVNVEVNVPLEDLRQKYKGYQKDALAACDVYGKLLIDEPTLIISDRIALDMFNTFADYPSTRNGTASSRQHSWQEIIIANAWLQCFRPFMEMNIVRPMLILSITWYKPPHDALDGAFLVAAIDGITAEAKAALPVAPVTSEFGAARSHESVALEFSVNVKGIKVAATVGKEEEVKQGLPSIHDTLLSTNTVDTVGHLILPGVKEDLSPTAHLNINCSMGELHADMSRLPSGGCIDYFQLMASITSAMMVSPLRKRPPSSCNHPKTSSLWITTYCQFSSAPIRILMVSEDLLNAILFEVESVLLQTSSYIGETSQKYLDSSLVRSSRLEANAIRLRTIGNLQSTEGLLQSLDYAILKHAQSVDCAVSIRRLELFTVDAIDPSSKVVPTVKIDELMCHLSIRSFYVGLMGILYYTKLVKLFASDGGSQNAPAARRSAKACTISVDRAVLDLELPEDNRLRFTLEPSTTKVSDVVGIQNDAGIASLELLMVENGIRYEELLVVHGMQLALRPDASQPRKTFSFVDCGMESISLTVPYGFKMSNIIENFINLQKGIKFLCTRHLGLRPRPNCSLHGKTSVRSEDIPVVTFTIGRATVKFMDDPFESTISRNYLLGIEEQEGRLARDKAFQRKAAALRAIDPNRSSAKSDSASGQPDEVESAWWMLQEFNSRAWADRIRESAKEMRTWFPPLMSATVTRITVQLEAPTLPAETVEKSLHIMDPMTPAKAVYGDLIARNVCISLDEASVQIRDYSLPLVQIPNSGMTSWKTDGLLIIAEQAPAPESKRNVDIPLHLYNEPPLRITRTVNPTKLYTALNTTIMAPSTLGISWGAATEPGIADMIGVIDTFTKPNIDPSIPLGWWDKLRLVMHGHNVIHITGGGDVRFRVLGSTSPYFDGRKHWGTEGVDILLSNGIRIDINGSTRAREDIIIECGELRLAVPGMASVARTVAGGDSEKSNIATLAGGVRIALGFDFVPTLKGKGRRECDEISLKRRSHADLILRSPEYCRLDDSKERWDSFKGFRTSNIDITIRIDSPRPFYSDLPEPLNWVSLSSGSLAHFFTVAQVYQSALTSIPIRRGKLFQEAGPGPSKQKLGRTIGSIRLITLMYPLLLSFITEAEEDNSGVGLRCRAEKMDVDMRWKQRLIRQRRPTEELLIRKSTVKWNLIASEMEVTEIEARSVAYGDAIDCREDVIPDELTLEKNENHDWLLAGEMQSNRKMKMIPFAWSPRIIYFKRNDGIRSRTDDHMRSRRDVYGVQMALFKNRLREIESSIRHYLEVQKGLEYRMAIFFDDSLRQQSQIIVEKMAVLHEKKVVIERYIRQCQKKLDGADLTDTSTLGRAGAKLPSCAVFIHHYIVHNVNFLWKKDVRNFLFKMISLQQRRMAVKYCLSTTATRVMKQLVSSVAKRKQHTDPPPSAVSDTSADLAKITQTISTKGSAMTIMTFDTSMAEQLLAKLIAETETNFVVPNESDRHADIPSDGHSREANASAFTSQRSYVPSRQPDSPDYIAQGQTYESNYIIQLIHPQVNLEAEPKGDPTQLETLVVAAESMQLRSILVLDAQASSAKSADEYSDRNEQIIKSRMILNIQDAQFFVARKAEIEAAPEFDLDNIVMHRNTSTSREPWPIWVPLECLIDHSSHSGHLERVVERTSASFHRDVPNPLYLQGDQATNSPETTETLYIQFPSITISANAVQYMVIYDVIENLLVYRDPVRGERTERLKKMLLALETMEDLPKVEETVLSLQQKIRQADSVLKYGFSSLERQMSGAAAADIRSLELQRHLLQYQDELIIIINALKAMQILEQKRKSVAVAWQTLVSIEKMKWCMLADDNTSLCEWMLDTAQFTWIQNEDQSSINTLQIDQVHLENQMATPNSFTQVIAPYHQEKRDIDFTRHKMLRVYWRELPPVAGIKVVDHFEVNIYPLLIQVTYDMAKQIVYYLFPEKKARAQAKHDELFGGSPSESKRFPRADSGEQLTVRSIRSFASEPAAMRRQSGSAEDVNSLRTSSRPESISESESSPQLERKRLFRGGPAYGHQKESSGRSDPSDSSPRLTRRESKSNELRQMQARASENRSFIYIKMPGAQHCLSYRGSKEKNIEDLYMFTFKMPTLEFRNKTWTWLDFLDAVKKEAFRAVLANTGALVREKLFQKRKTEGHAEITEQAPAASSAPVQPSQPSRPKLKPSLRVFKGKKDKEKDKGHEKEKEFKKEKNQESGKAKMETVASREVLFDVDFENV